MRQSELTVSILDVTQQYYDRNPRFVTLTTPNRNRLGMRENQISSEPKTVTEIIYEEMSAVVPVSSFCLADYTHNPEHKNTVFKVGLVYVTDPHTYVAVPAQRVINEYRNAFYEYLPNLRGELNEVMLQHPSGFPEHKSSEYLPLHATVWCFAEVDGKIQPLDALTLLTGAGYLAKVKGKDRLRFDLLYAMNEYSHVAAVGLYHLYEDYLLKDFVTAIYEHRNEFQLSELWTYELLRKNFSLFLKGIRRHINIGYDPAEFEAGEWFGLLDGFRSDNDNGRCVASQPSAHIFLREIPFKKFWRVFRKFLSQNVQDASITEEEYKKLDKLVHLVLENSPAWQPEEDERIFNFIPNSQFIAEDTERFIKALDPYANWEGEALLDLIGEPLEKVLKPLGLFGAAAFNEMAEAIQPYNQKITTFAMNFAKPNDEAAARRQPTEIMMRIGDVLLEAYRAKRMIYQPDDTIDDTYVFLSKQKVDAWQQKMLAYQPTRRTTEPSIDCSYSLNDSVDTFNENLEKNWDKKDTQALLSQFASQWMLYHWEELVALNVGGEQLDTEHVLQILLASQFSDNDSKIEKKRQIITQALTTSSVLKPIVEQVFRRIVPLLTRGEQGEVKLAKYLVLRSLENDRLGIKPKGQRTLNTTRLPGLLLWYDYVRDSEHGAEYLKFSLSPIISEASSVEKNKGMSLVRAADKMFVFQ